MKRIKNETFNVKSIFKSEKSEMRKSEFNKRYENYINFCESKI